MAAAHKNFKELEEIKEILTRYCNQLSDELANAYTKGLGYDSRFLLDLDAKKEKEWLKGDDLLRRIPLTEKDKTSAVGEFANLTYNKINVVANTLQPFLNNGPLDAKKLDELPKKLLAVEVALKAPRSDFQAARFGKLRGNISGAEVLSNIRAIVDKINKVEAAAIAAAKAAVVAEGEAEIAAATVAKDQIVAEEKAKLQAEAATLSAEESKRTYYSIFIADAKKYLAKLDDYEYGILKTAKIDPSKLPPVDMSIEPKKREGMSPEALRQLQFQAISDGKSPDDQSKRDALYLIQIKQAIISHTLAWLTAPNSGASLGHVAEYYTAKKYMRSTSRDEPAILKTLDGNLAGYLLTPIPEKYAPLAVTMFGASAPTLDAITKEIFKVLGLEIAGPKPETAAAPAKK